MEPELIHSYDSIKKYSYSQSAFINVLYNFDVLLI
ncbi:hypothetical protein FHS10_001471 [Mucilaginibacter dorajii]|nr:hypothetical protein [Mucilaginibacter dorajii]